MAMTKFNLSKLNKSFKTKEKYKERDDGSDGSDNMRDIFHHLEPAYNEIYELFLQCQAYEPNNEDDIIKTGNNS